MQPTFSTTELSGFRSAVERQRVVPSLIGIVAHSASTADTMIVTLGKGAITRELNGAMDETEGAFQSLVDGINHMILSEIMTKEELVVWFSRLI